jgi:hypothetical protein
MSEREKLFNWIEQQHKDQLVRKTTLPYVHHLKAVAEMAGIVPLGYEIGLCHDLLEKTTVTANALKDTLIEFGYSEAQAMTIVSAVTELTNVFTKTAYPDMRKAVRKENEAERMANISSIAQTVKYADLLYNTGWMQAHDPKHLKKYLLKKQWLLKIMCKGDQFLYRKLLQHIEITLSALHYLF